MMIILKAALIYMSKVHHGLYCCFIHINSLISIPTIVTGSMPGRWQDAELLYSSHDFKRVDKLKSYRGRIKLLDLYTQSKSLSNSGQDLASYFCSSMELDCSILSVFLICFLSFFIPELIRSRRHPHVKKSEIISADDMMLYT